MSNRLIKDSICTSENIDTLTAFQETFFYRLIVNCDDYGRMDARPRILAARLFPLKNIRDEQIQDALRALTSAELVILYEVDGKPFLQMKTWERHQQIRARKSKYPEPDESNGYQLISDDIKCPRNPIQSNTNPNPIQTRKSANGTEVPPGFEKFWETYPKKKAKPDAMKAFRRVNPNEQQLAAMIAAIEKQKQTHDWQKDNGQFIPYPATWLNQHRWEDEDTEIQPEQQEEYKPRYRMIQDGDEYVMQEVADDE